jgi:hypothetical protein
MITTTTFPPKLSMNFDSNLLSRPTPKFRDDSETILRMFLWLMKKMEKKCQNPNSRHDKFYQIQEEFLELYGRIEKKEKELETASEDFKKRSFYYFPSVNRNLRNVYEGLRKGSWNIRSYEVAQFRNNYKI